jgi:hypothetical protein
MTSQSTDACANQAIGTIAFWLFLRCLIPESFHLFLLLYLPGLVCIYVIAFPRLHLVGPPKHY